MPLGVVITRRISMEKPAKEVNAIIAYIANKLSRHTFDTIYYRRQVEPEKIRMVLQAHSEGSSLRGVCRITKLAYNKVFSLVRGASVWEQTETTVRLVVSYFNWILVHSRKENTALQN